MKNILLPSLFVKIQCFDEAGNLSFSLAEKGHSWVRNAYLYALACLTGVGGGGVDAFGAGYISSKTTGGGLFYSTALNMDRISSSVVTTSGIVPSNTLPSVGLCVGSGDTAFSVENFSLAALIYSGSGSGQLGYAAQAAPVSSYDVKVWSIAHKRLFTNSSGALITVKEVGLCFYGCLFSASQSFLLARDVLSVPVDIVHLGNLELTYVLTYDFSAID